MKANPIHKLLNKAGHFIIAPFYTNLRYTAAWFLLVLFTPIALLFYSTIPFAFFVFVNLLAQTYVLALPLSLLTNKYVRSIFIWSVTIYYIIFLCFDLFCCLIFKFPFGFGEAQLIVETNANEASGMISMYFVWWHLLIFIAILAFDFLVFKFLSRLKPSYKASTIAGIIVLTFLAVTVKPSIDHYRDAMALGTISKPILIYSRVGNMPTNEMMSTHSQISVVGEMPCKVVLIMGESHSRNHSSLYGYPLTTNPRLEQMQKDGNLIVFTSVQSAYKRTTEAFKRMMSSFTGSDEKQWYEYDNLPVVLRNAGITTRWISNQERMGLHDTAVTRYAQLCDTCVFTSHATSTHDGLLLPIIQTLRTDSTTFDLIHLMGSHEQFIDRYPDKFSKFNPSDYLSKPVHQREQLAHYDNSLLYNDWILGRIIDMYKDQEALIIYTSDHGLDLYESSDDYIGHASELSSDNIGRNVPFMVFISDKFAESFPETTMRIKNSTEHPYNLTNLMYTIMDIYSLTYSDSKTPMGPSIFQ